jgi:cytochrome c biogenesis protein CcdA
MSGLESQLPTLLTVIATAAIDAINPCAIGVLILMISVIMTSGGSTKRLLLLGFLYTFSVMMVYLLAGLGLMYFYTTIPLYVAEYISIVVGILIVFAAVIEIKDYFWYGHGFSLAIPARFAKMIHVYSQRVTIPGVIFLGAFVSAVELPCTGAPYLAIITILSQYFDFTAFLLLVLYNVIFVSPLIIILLLVAAGMNVQKLKLWKQGARGHMRLFIGLLLIALGWLLILIANGTINLG